MFFIGGVILCSYLTLLKIEENIWVITIWVISGEIFPLIFFRYLFRGISVSRLVYYGTLSTIIILIFFLNISGYVLKFKLKHAYNPLFDYLLEKTIHLLLLFPIYGTMFGFLGMVGMIELERVLKRSK